MSDEDFLTFKLGNWKLQSGEELPDAWIAYKTFGDPKAEGGAILYPTWYSGKISDNTWLLSSDKLGQDLALNPSKYFIIITALFGNGQSISPSNSPEISHFPTCTFYDNVRAQHELLTKHLGISHLRCVLGWSMGAAQTFQWATQYPDFMDLAVPFCGSARTSLHNQVFLEGVKSALLAAKGISSAGVCAGGVGEKECSRRWSEEERKAGLKALGRVYAGWGFSQTFYRIKEHEKVYGAKDLEDFMVNFWEGWALSKDPENMLTMLLTWQKGDVSKQEPYNGDFEAAMRAIKARTLVLPGKTDLYFPPEDSEYEVKNMRPGTGTMESFPSIWGHWAGGPPGNWEDAKWLDRKLKAFFAANPAPSIQTKLIGSVGSLSLGH